MRLGIGAPSIFMIFVILVMCVLAILSYLRANSYYESSVRQANITSQYYESESRLLTKYYQLDSQNLEYSLENLQIEYQKEDDLYMLEDKINDSQVLQLSFVQENDKDVQTALGILTYNPRYASREIKKLLEEVVTKGASDIFIVAGSPCAIKIDGRISKYSDERLTPHDTERMIRDIYEIANNAGIEEFMRSGDDDFSFSIPNVGRFRVNAYRQRNSCAAVLRVVSFQLPDPEVMHIPKVITDLANQKKGMVLVTGPAGSGKSTTLACIIDQINRNRNTHIITIEDPIEYLHSHDKSIVSQREVYHDTHDYVSALRAALREAPEVILVGEMRDLETIDIAVTAAETGHLVFSSLHTVGAANTIDRMIDVFPPSQQQQIRVQLAMVLNAVISQQLVPGIDGKMIPVFEIMICNQAIRTLIRDGKTHQIDNAISTNRQIGMVTMDDAIVDLYKQNKITKETAVMYASNPNLIERKF